MGDHRVSIPPSEIDAQEMGDRRDSLPPSEIDGQEMGDHRDSLLPSEIDAQEMGGCGDSIPPSEMDAQEMGDLGDSIPPSEMDAQEMGDLGDSILPSEMDAQEMVDHRDSIPPSEIDANGCEEDLACHSPKECSREVHNSSKYDVIPTPKSGMIFGSEDEVRSYYTKYANQEGFSFMTRSSRKKNDGRVEYFTLACSREGIRRSHTRKGLRNVSTIRSVSSRKQNCEAKINVSLCKDGTYRIQTVTLNHNHELSPGQVRIIDMRVKSTSVQTDYRNCLQKERRLIGKDGDSDALCKYFAKMQEQDSNFFYLIDLDDCFCVRNVLWVDARSRAAYKSFGDVVTLDTTYLSNRYKLPLVTFVGANHHGQSLLFGCGLLSGEDTESYIWLFQSWLHCMSGLSPKGIITDQCKAMQNAIEIAFPSTRHQWCLWHIMKKLPQKIHAYAKYKSIRDHLQNVVYDSLTENEFDKNWKKIVEEFGLQDNKWLKELFLERYRWVPTFVRGDFWAGMSITQQSESIHTFFDGYINRHTTLKQFVDLYNNALQDKAVKEFETDLRSISCTVACATHSPIERQFQSAYTHAKFLEVQEEFIGKADCNVSVAHDDGSICHYNVIEDVIIRDKPEEAMLEVSFNRVNFGIKCMCNFFEFKGILCRHSLAILSQERVKEVPCKYILDRWRKKLKRKYAYIKTSYSVKQLQPQMQRYDLLCNQFECIANVAAEFEEISYFVSETLCDLKEKVEAWASHLRDSSEGAVSISEEAQYIGSILGVGDAII